MSHPIEVSAHCPADFSGLPKHWEIAGYRQPRPGEYCLMNGSVVAVEQTASYSPQLIIRPEAGYKAEYDIVNDAYKAVRLLPHPKTLQLTFRCDSEEDEQRLRSLKHPGLIDIREV